MQQTEPTPLDRTRRDGFAGPGIEHTSAEDVARAAITAAKGALHEHSVQLHQAGCHEAAHPVVQAFAALRDRYPQLPESASCATSVLIPPDFRDQLADEIDAQASRYEADDPGTALIAWHRAWATEVRETGRLSIPADHPTIGRSELASLLAYVEIVCLDGPDESSRDAEEWRSFAKYAALRAELPIRPDAA